MEKKIGILISGGGSNMKAIVKDCEAGKIDAEVVFVGADTPDAKGLVWAKKRGIPTFVSDYGRFSKNNFPDNAMSYERHSWDDVESVLKLSGGIIPKSITEDRKIFWLKRRMCAEDALLEEIGKYEFDYLVLAGYMKNLSSYFIDQLSADPDDPRIINIHPAILPSFPGVDGYGDTFTYGCKVGGCTVHFVDYGEDTGPIIGQGVVPRLPGDTLDDFKDRGLHKEWQVYPECIQLVVTGKTMIIEEEYKGEKRRVVQINI